MDVVTLIAFVGSMYLAGRIAKRRGRSIRNWVWTAAVIGPLTLPLVLLFPDLRGGNGEPA
jgi:H+/Cl- antiporter ClcA